ncbi:tubulin polymerization-promoting protein homolog [Microplitis mediator]|uniref:tubulin polymerization-promoting protein homolog n=1 Tax=Microplitis mediator TaxID=375433 RepID=UPI0025571CFA|nr:tubulin polymerization-promoting protein homolog [Microplitis mediator]
MLVSEAAKKKERIVPLREMFEAYCQLDTLADVIEVDLLSFSQLNKWLVDANVIDESRVTTTDAFLCFFQFKKRAISYDEFLVYLEDLADTKELNLSRIKYKLQTCGKPPEPRDSSA